mmetsp:Transcript_82900/g.230663  ORF Transcript_82900/g.230663 Transcript_82900/m.230663 type:complete len:146 (-) Transcript_82900:39-476(-)
MRPYQQTNCHVIRSFGKKSTGSTGAPQSFFLQSVSAAFWCHCPHRRLSVKSLGLDDDHRVVGVACCARTSTADADRRSDVMVAALASAVPSRRRAPGATRVSDSATRSLRTAHAGCRLQRSTPNHRATRRNNMASQAGGTRGQKI